MAPSIAEITSTAATWPAEGVEATRGFSRPWQPRGTRLFSGPRAPVGSGSSRLAGFGCKKNIMKLISSVLFVQDGKPAVGLKDPRAVVTAGSTLRGHTYVSVSSAARNVKVKVRVDGTWKCTWRPRRPVYGEDGRLVGQVVEGTMEARKAVARLSLDVYDGSLLRGEHGLPVAIALPPTLPPSLETPASSAALSPVPISAKCVYTVTVTVTAHSKEAGSEERSFSLPLTVLAPSGIRAAIIRNQPRPLAHSNRLALLAPGTLPHDAATLSPFTFSDMDPLDPVLRTLTTPVTVVPIKDKGILLYDLDVPRLHHYIGDQIPFTMAIKPRYPIHRIYSVTASLITHIHFKLPSTLAPHTRPPSSAIAVRIFTETFPWPHTPNTPAHATHRFHFSLPADMRCPTLPDTPQNRLPLGCLHMLRVSVRVETLAEGGVGREDHAVLDAPQPASAVRVSAADALVLDVPVVLVSKGAC
ncbi:hypothetical protein BC830DRAFT_489303 [Chytriomyces sp. MP71]|nr:hypothetical protein BC830DRAFT_489303 [Chytriomyces sp. MP71]